MGKITLVAGIMVLILVGGFLWRQNKEASNEIIITQPKAPPPPAAPLVSGPELTITPVASVVYGNSGFSPERLTIKAGTIVVFKNESGLNPMWVASDIHPTHKLLPDFDQLQGANKGTVYEYTFTQTGVWAYHNHLSPLHGGAVTVE